MSDNLSVVATAPAYNSSDFINREAETNLVTKKAEDLAQGFPIDERTVVFMGQRGAGKSWLMHHLKTKIDEISGLTWSFVDLKDYAESTADEVVRELFRKLGADLLDQQLSLEADLSELSREFMQNLRSKLVDQPFVLLVDTVFESDWRLLAMLENYLLGPLAIERKVLIVMAGRGHAYPWKTPELRLRAKFHDLETFDPDYTKSQLKSLNSLANVERIYKLSQGNPLANYMLAVQPDSALALSRTIDEMLGVVSEDRRQEIREYLEALSVLNAFDEEQIPTMFAAYYKNKSYKDWNKGRKVREEIVKLSFAHWDEEKKGYAIESTLLNLLQSYLKTPEQQDKWIRLNCAAYDLYISWTNIYSRTSQRWQTEANYHSSQLNEMDFSPENCPSFEN